MLNSFSATVDVDTPVEAAYTLWRRGQLAESEGPAAPEEERSSPSMRPWAVRVNGTRRGDAFAALEATPVGRMPLATPSALATLAGELAFDALDDGHARITMSLEWNPARTESQDLPWMLLDGMRINTELLRLTRQLEEERDRSRDWRVTLSHFEDLDEDADLA